MIIIFFFLYINSMFFNIRYVSYQTYMMKSILLLSRHLTYCIDYDDYMRSRYPYYYINLDVHRNFLLDGHG